MDLSQLFGFSPICFKIFLSDRSNNGAKIFIGLKMDPQVSKWMHLSSSILRNFMMQTLVDVIIPTYTSNSERHVQPKIQQTKIAVTNTVIYMMNPNEPDMNAIFTLFTFVPLSTVIPLYCLHLIAAPSTVE